MQVRRRGSGAVTDGAEEAIGLTAGDAGHALPDDVRERFEGSLGADLSAVRVHDGDSSAAAATAVGARAFAVGDDVHFAAGQYDPSSTDGLFLLAHEVAHTQQQAGGTPGMQAKLEVSAPGDAAEVEADHAAAAMVAGQPAQVSGGATMISRDAAPRSDLTADMLKVSAFNLQKAGNVTATPAGSDVKIDAPKVTFDATVELVDGVSITDQPNLEVGPIQNVLGSSRASVYQRADGGISKDMQAINGKHRDAQWQQDKRGNITADVHEPWYSMPVYITQGKRSDSVGFFDQPGWTQPREKDGGKLIRIEGSDQFALSLSAMRGGTRVDLKTVNWDIPWAMPIQDTASSGGPVGGGEGGSAPSVTGGPIAVNAAKEYTKFDTVEAAKQVGARRLLDMLPQSKDDADAHAKIVEALKQLNPQFHVDLKCVNCFSWVGNDKVRLVTKAQREAEISLSLDSGDTGHDVTNLTTVLDLERMVDHSSVVFQAHVDGKLLWFTYRYPFRDTGFQDMESGKGRYQIKISVS